jgi:hypothetical protein
MTTVKVTIKREQLLKAIDATWGTCEYNAFTRLGHIPVSKIDGPLPLEITLELPAEQIDTTVSDLAQDVLTFEELEKVGKCPAKRKQYLVSRKCTKAWQAIYPGIGDGEIIELEEVD